MRQFLDYAVSNPDAVLTYSASNMVLAGWREKDTGLWRIPLEEEIDKDNVENPNTQTALTQMAPTTILKEKNVANFCATSSRNLPILCKGNTHNNFNTIKRNCGNAVKAT